MVAEGRNFSVLCNCNFACLKFSLMMDLVTCASKHMPAAADGYVLTPIRDFIYSTETNGKVT